MKTVLVALAAAIWMLGVIGVASAQEKKPKPTAAEVTEARRLFQSGARAYDAGRFDVAVQAFDQAYELAPRISLRFSAAQALRRLHTQDPNVEHLKKALSYYRAYLDEVKEGRRVKDAAEAVNEIELTLAKLEPPPKPADDDDDDDGAPSPAPAPSSPSLATLDVYNTPPGAVATIAGQTDVHRLPKWIDLLPGNYHVTVSAPGFVSKSFPARLSSGRVSVIDGSLLEQPARLVLAGLDGCDVVVDGRAVGRTPLSAPLELASGDHHLVVGKAGHKVLSRSVALTPGQELTVEVELGMTVQRGFAWAFISTAVGAGATGGTFTALAAMRRSDAADIAARRTTEGRDLTVAEAEEHNDEIETSNNFAGLAVASFGASLLAAGLGLGLYFVDEPDLFATEDDEDTSWQLLPLPYAGVDDGGVGAGLSLMGSF